MSATPSVLVFDVNETLLDIDSMAPLFGRIFADPQVLREWFGQLVTYSMTTTLSDHYVDYFTLGQGLLRMLADVHHATITDGLATLRDNGFRLVSLTNSPPNPHGPTPLEHAGLGQFIERQFSVDPLRAYKPAAAVYLYVCRELDVAPADCMMVSAHVWDNVGAQSAGFGAALITRPGNAVLPVEDLPQPTLVAADLCALAQQLGSAAGG
jgi:2-haloacid dehalogenase